MARIFLSHSSEDQEQAARLLEWLHAQGFASTFLDSDEKRGIAVGADWERTLYREISSADAVILILTKNWFNSKWCFVEFAQARALGKAIFPLVESPTGETFVSSDIQHLDLVKDREGGLQRLRVELTRIAINTRGGFPWDGTRSPFPGLLAFDETDAAIYFGRDDDIRRLIERLNARRAQGGDKLVALLGASGSGKSSLLRAGVVPRLKRDPHNWIVLPPFRPQIQPLDELAQAVATGVRDGKNWRRWRAAFEAEELIPALSDLARDLRAACRENEAHILLVIDQGEELFGGPDRKQAEQFFRVLSALLDTSLPFLAVIALRSDYLGKLQEASGLTASFEDFTLKPMPLERVRDVIEGPARVAGVAVDDGLVKAAAADAHTADALPLLAFVLREVYDCSAGGGRLTLGAYRALGDASADLSPLENAVRKKADEVLGAAKPAPEDLQALKDAFIPAMVRVNADGEYVRRPAEMASFPQRALPLIERLAKARLLTIRAEQNATLIEVAHEALLRRWPLLRGWLDSEREFLVGKTQLEQDLREWESVVPDQKSDALLTGLRLARARSWLAEKPHQLDSREREFIQASIDRQEANESERVSRQLAAQSMPRFATDLRTAFRQAVEAADVAHTIEAEIALHMSLASPRELCVLRHKAGVFSAAFSPDGKRIATASKDTTARVWDADDGRLIFMFTNHTDAVHSAVFSPDGKHIVTTSDDGTARVWDARDGHLQHTLSGHAGSVVSAVFSPSSKRIATASLDNTARVWDACDGHLQFTLAGHTNQLTTIQFSPDGNRIVTASTDKTARIWNARNGQLLSTCAGHINAVWSASFSQDGKQVVTASFDNTARIWDADDGRPLVMLLGHRNSVWSAAFAPDGARILTASWDGTARVWNAGDGHPLFTLTGHSDSATDAAFSPDGNWIVTASVDGTARVWNARDGHLCFTLDGHSGEVSFAGFSPDGSRIVMACADGSTRMWDATDARILASLAGHIDYSCDPVFSPDGKRIVAGADEDAATVWDAGDGQPLAILKGHTAFLTSAAFSPNGKRVVTASYDTTARVWNAADGRPVVTLAGHEAMVNTAVFSPEGKRIVTASDDQTARLWDAGTGRLLATVKGHTSRVKCAIFSPEGNRILTGGDDGTVRVWDARNGDFQFIFTEHSSVDSIRFLPGGQRILTTRGTPKVWDANGRELFTLIGHSADFSPDGKRIVTASFHHAAQVWDASEGRLLFTLTGHTDVVHSALFSPDGRRIATASSDGTARVWNASEGRLLATLAGYSSRAVTAVFSPDGSCILTASEDGKAHIYMVDFDRLLARANHFLSINSSD